MRILNVVVLAVTISLVAGICRAERISRGAPGTVPCGDDKAVRVLAVGGELQANSWCNKKVVHKDNTGKVIPGKTAGQERAAFNAAREAERQRKKQAEAKELERREREATKKLVEEKRRLEAEAKKAAEVNKKREHDCRGLGRGAGCTQENPGHTGRIAAKEK